MKDSMKELLLVDDNDRYARILEKYFARYGYRSTRAVYGHEALRIMQEKGVDAFDLVVTDITMESQLAGISMLRKMHAMGLRSPIIVASTGFDVILAKTLGRFWLKRYGVTYLVPKTTVLAENLLFYPMDGSAPHHDFEAKK